MRTIAKRTPKEAKAAKTAPEPQCACGQKPSDNPRRCSAKADPGNGKGDHRFEQPGSSAAVAGDLESTRLDAERIVAGALLAREFGLATVSPQGIAGRTDTERDEWHRAPLTMRLAGFLCEKLAATRATIAVARERDGTREETRRILAVEEAKANAYAMILEAIKRA